MRIPPELNLVRLRGLALATPPRGFKRAPDLPGDHQHYAVRDGYRLDPCPTGHGFNRGCAKCVPFHGAVAIETEVTTPARSARAVRTVVSKLRRSGLLCAKGVR